jgi:hypothetical protein
MLRATLKLRKASLVRIAGRRPLISTPQLRLHRLLAPLCALAVAAAIAAALSLRGGGSSDRIVLPATTMADAIGVGGLPALSLGDEGLADVSLLAGNTLVAYYGTPRQPEMGILGEHDGETIAWLLAARAARFDALNGAAGVLPALHLVFGVAQPETGADGLYLRYVDERTVRQYLDLARRYGFALVLDLQIGHSSALDEVRKILPYLEEPDVHVALDPEFALAGGATPGAEIGTLDASDINAVQWLLAEFARRHHLPKKVLVVHQFEASMISDTPAIERRSGVDLVIDMDGYGPADIKTVKYQRYGAAPYAPYGGIKLFLRHDPDLMTEEQLLDIEPQPTFFLYQ